MTQKAKKLKEFAAYGVLLDGDEKGEAQVFCDRLFQAFGHGGYKEAGATLEYRIKKKSTGGTSFADLLWPGRVLIEMKKRGTRLSEHLRQAFDYWINAVPNRPRYVVLCNFDEFLIYDFDIQIDQPVDTVSLDELPLRYAPLNFLFPDEPTPVFGNDRVAVTREAADQLVSVYNSLVSRGENGDRAQRFILQVLVALFAEDMDLIPDGLMATIISDCIGGQNSYDLMGALFHQMNSPDAAPAGRYIDVPFFNGGLFSVIEPCELKGPELAQLAEAASQDWAKVNPAIFGTIFQDSTDAEERHAYGAHFTSEADILRVVIPTVVRPWRDRIDSASTLSELLKLRRELTSFRVLDPACGSGNFLYVTFRELIRLEVEILKRIRRGFSPRTFEKHVHTVPTVSPQQFFGIEINGFGAELAKVTLMLAKKLGIDEAVAEMEYEQADLNLFASEAIPLDNLDANVLCQDALFTSWPRADAIIGNPPYQSKNKIQQELGRAYVNRLREAMPDVPGRADYCVYWFRKAHDELAPGKRAGLVGTNTIRQNYSRQGGLDYIVKTGGTITEAVSTQVWSGDAVVHVSIVNWIKGEGKGPKKLLRQLGDNPGDPWEVREMDKIGPALSFDLDVTGAGTLNANAKGCYQGQTHGHEGFLLTLDETKAAVRTDPTLSDVLHPLFIAEELIGQVEPHPRRYVIDFYPHDQLTARRYTPLFNRIKAKVLPDREEAAEKEEERNQEARRGNPQAKVTRHHANFLRTWWQMSYPRGDMLKKIGSLSRYIVCGRVTKRPIFEFVSPKIHPNDALMVFPFEDDYSFGILQSAVHWAWFTAKCSTLKGDWRYTSNTVFATFPWPQSPSTKGIESVAGASRKLRSLRSTLMRQHGLSLREMYKTLEGPGKHPLRAARDALDRAVMGAYGMKQTDEPLEFLLELNLRLQQIEEDGGAITPPGLPASYAKPRELVSKDRINMPPGSP
ncbi:DNA methyltransferase [Gemmatimonadota bacterium]